MPGERNANGNLPKSEGIHYVPSCHLWALDTPILQWLCLTWYKVSICYVNNYKCILQYKRRNKTRIVRKTSGSLVCLMGVVAPMTTAEFVWGHPLTVSKLLFLIPYPWLSSGHQGQVSLSPHILAFSSTAKTQPAGEFRLKSRYPWVSWTLTCQGLQAFSCRRGHEAPRGEGSGPKPHNELCSPAISISPPSVLGKVAVICSGLFGKREDIFLLYSTSIKQWRQLPHTQKKYMFKQYKGAQPTWLSGWEWTYELGGHGLTPSQDTCPVCWLDL